MAVKFGVFVPQGWKMDLGVRAERANLEAAPALAQRAEELERDAAWVAQHHAHREGGLPSPLVFLTAVAAHQELARRNDDERHAWSFAPPVPTTRRRPYLRTKRSATAGASALRTASPRERRCG